MAIPNVLRFHSEQVYTTGLTNCLLKPQIRPKFKAVPTLTMKLSDPTPFIVAQQPTRTINVKIVS